jgi:hypothetical protein
MTNEQAEVIHALLDAATESNWPTTVAAMAERGFKPPEIVRAWQALEDMTGSTGSVPLVSDF